QLRYHQIGDMVVNRRPYENDALLEEAGIDVHAALAARRLLDHVGHEQIAWGGDRAGASLPLQRIRVKSRCHMLLPNVGDLEFGTLTRGCPRCTSAFTSRKHPA